MTRIRWAALACKLSLLHWCCLLVAAEIEYYPDSEGAAGPEAGLERLARLLERRGRERDEEAAAREAEAQQAEAQEERARQAWSAGLLEQSLAMQAAGQRLLREEAEALERPELPERPALLELLHQAARQRQRQRLRDYQARLQRQRQQRLQELDYPEPRAALEQERARPEFSYALRPGQAAARPFAVGPGDPRFYSSREWAEPGPTAAAQPAKVEQRRAGAGRGGGGGGGGGGAAAAAPGAELRVVSLRQRLGQQDAYVVALVAGCSAALVFALVLTSLLWCRLQRVSKAAKDVDYPAYGVTGPNKDLSPSSAADQRLAQSAQMYHFQHQKQQIIAMEKPPSGAAREPGSVSEAESDEENDEGDYTVYECPGLAPTAEMEVKNPLFRDEQPTPQTPARPCKRDYTTDEDEL